MGYRFFVDGLCRKCGKSAMYFCDACGLYFCDDHLIKTQVPDSPKFFIFCESCLHKKKKPLDPYRQHTNPSFRH
ncbi:hypothetical protein J4434_00240 [Candidatus Woesearchaeota archaeon]|nr:hypothetical protein [Candidatus Woesearchaeota archaeon]